MKDTLRTYRIPLITLIIVLGGIWGMWFVNRAAQPVPKEMNDTMRPQVAQEAPGGLAQFDTDGDGTVYQDGMHPWIVLDAPGPSPDCGMALTPVRVEETEEGTVRVDPISLQNSGVRISAVEITSLIRDVRATGRFVMDEEGEYTVSLKTSGWIEKLYANFEGARVSAGSPLLELYSPELVSAQEEYLLALRNAERLMNTSITTDAGRIVDAARRRLVFLDMTEQQIDEIGRSGEPKRTVTYFTPSGGEVMFRKVSEGEHVSAGQPLMDIVDVSRIWLRADVFDQDLAWIKVGAKAHIEMPYAPGTTIQGRVDFIYHMLETQTRAATARIILPGGHSGKLKPGMYATVHIEGVPSAPGLVVPEEAIIRSGLNETVILALGEGRFKPVHVRTGMSSGGLVQVLEGLAEHDMVVTSAQFLIDSEARLRSSLNAMAGMPGMTDMDGEPAPQPHLGH